MEFKAKDRRLEGDTILRQTQLAELYLLDIFVEICEKHNLQYFLDSGTLLGAVRHGGFIPWDDDIDVGMPVDDFKKFLKIAEKELPDNLLIKKPSFFFGKPEGMAKLMDMCSFFCEPHTNIQVPSGIFIDIFPFDLYPKFEKKTAEILSNMFVTIWFSYRAHCTFPFKQPHQLFYSAIMSFMWKWMWRAGSVAICFLKLFKPLTYHYSSGIGFSGWIGQCPENIFPLSKVEFEGKLYFAPKETDLVLSDYYGDWRTLPPPEKRQWHASIISPTKAPNVWWAKPYNPPPKDN